MFCFTDAVDHPRAGDVVAVLSGVGDRPALLGDAALVHQVNDQLELVQALEVGHLRLVAGLDRASRIRTAPAAEAPPHSTACSPNRSVSVSSVNVVLMPPARSPPMALAYDSASGPGGAGGVLLDGNDDRDAAAGDVLAAHQVAGTLGCDHADVDVGRRLDVAETDVEPVAEEQRVSGAQVAARSSIA